MALNLDEKRRTAVKPEAAAAPFISFMIGEVITSTGWRIVAQLALAILLGIFIYKTRPKAEKQKYGWQAGSNSAGVGEAVPVVYGTHKAYGHVLQSSVVTSGDKQWAEILMAVSEGWIHGIRDVRINDQPVENFKPVDGLPSVVYQTRTGTEGQGPISWFKGVNNSRAVNRPLADGTETVWTTLADDVTNFNVTIAFNSGLYHMESDGDISDNSVAFGIKYRRYGDSAWSAEKFCPVTSKARTRLVKVYHSYEFEDPKVPIDKGKWDICIRRLAPAEVRSRFGHYEPRRVCDDGGCWTENVWIEPPIERNINSPSDSVIEYVDEINLDLVPKYPNTALLGVRILASQIMNGSFPNISCVVEGRQFSIRKDGVWADPGGAVDNPAWVVYDLMTNKRFGLGNYIRTADLDLDSFEQFAAYCDEQVPIDNGNGVTTWEKRHTCNIILDQAEPALDVIHKILSSCRGLLVESDGKYRLVAEAPGNVTQIFTMGNIVKDSFQTHWASTKEEYNTVEVQYFDAVKEYERCTVRYSNHPTDPKLLPNNAKVAQVELPGVTRYSQAKREANYRLNMVTSLSQSVEFDAALDAIACRVGDIIGVSHDVPQWGYSGRLRSLISGTTSTLVVDRTDLPYDPAKTYEIWLRSVDDATILPYPVVSVDGNTLQVSGAVPVLPEGSKPQDIVYAFGEVDKSVKLFRVMSITLNEDLTRHVSAAEYSAAVYYETPIALDELPVASDLGNPKYAPRVALMHVKQSEVVLPDSRTQVYLDVDWTVPEDKGGMYKAGRVYLRRIPGSYDYREVGEGYNSFRIPITPGDWEVTVASVSSLGLVQQPDDGLHQVYTVAGKTAAPLVPQGALALAGVGSIRVAWEPNLNNPDLAGYEVYMGDTADFLADTENYANRIWVGQATECSVTVPSGVTKYFRVRAYDNFGLASDLTAAVSGTASGVDVTAVATETPAIPVMHAPQSAGSSNYAYVVASWEANAASDGVAQYEVRVRKAGDTQYYTQTTTALTCSIGPFDFGGTYYVTVRAINLLGRASEGCAEQSVVTTGDLITQPAPPTNLTVSPASSKLIMSWGAPTTEAVAGYEVHLGDAAGFVLSAATRKWSGLATVISVDVAPDTPYFVAVRSINGAGVVSAPLRPNPDVATNATKILGTQIAEDSITTAHIVADGLDAAVIKTGELDAGIIKTGVLDATLVTIQGGGGTSLAGNGLRVSDGTADRLVVGDLSGCSWGNGTLGGRYGLWGTDANIYLKGYTRFGGGGTVSDGATVASSTPLVMPRVLISPSYFPVKSSVTPSTPLLLQADYEERGNNTYKVNVKLGAQSNTYVPVTLAFPAPNPLSPGDPREVVYPTAPDPIWGVDAVYGRRWKIRVNWSTGTSGYVIVRAYYYCSIPRDYNGAVKGWHQDGTAINWSLMGTWQANTPSQSGTWNMDILPSETSKLYPVYPSAIKLVVTSTSGCSATISEVGYWRDDFYDVNGSAISETAGSGLKANYIIMDSGY